MLRASLLLPAALWLQAPDRQANAGGEEAPRKGHEVLLTVRGLPEEGGFGTAFGPLYDVDGDGLVDFYVTAPYRGGRRARRGSVRLCSGADGRTLWRARGEAFLERGPYQEGQLGVLATPCGDVDGDGSADLVAVSAHRMDDDTQRIALHVLSGRTGERLHGLLREAWWIQGASLGTIGDIDDDGVDDVWIGIPGLRGDDGGLGALALYSPGANNVLGVHMGSGDGFGSVGWSDGLGVAWLAAPAGPAARLWRATRAGLEPTEAAPPLVEGGRGSWGSALSGLRRTSATGGATEVLVATRTDTEFRVEHVSAAGAALGGVGGFEGPPTLAATPAFFGAPGEAQFAASWVDDQRRGHVRVLDLESPITSEIEHHACGHPFAVAPAIVAMDVDGDGRSELLIGAPHFHGHPLSSQGEVQLVRGADAAREGEDAAAFDARVLAERGVLALLTPSRPSEVKGSRAGFGARLVAPGDLDADGTGDLLVGVWTAGEKSQQLLAYSGATAARLFAIVDDKLFGFAGCADRDGDGGRDLAVLSTHVPQRPGGAVWIASGSSGLPVFEGRAALAGWGQHVLEVPDVDGDGVAELLVGAPSDSDGDGTKGPASARLHAGADGAELLRWDRGDRHDGFGSVLAAAGDLDADGVGDLWIGAPRASFEDNERDRRGAAFAYSGKTGAELQALFGAAHGELFGHALVATPDLDADGVPDVAIAAPKGGADRAGCVVVVSSATGARLAHFTGERPDELFGQALLCRESADVAAELLVGAPVAAHVFPTSFGRVYAYALPDGRELYRLNDPPRSDDAIRGDFGWSLADPGDLNDDGRRELAVGAPYVRRKRDDGSVWIFSGAVLVP